MKRSSWIGLALAGLLLAAALLASALVRGPAIAAGNKAFDQGDLPGAIAAWQGADAEGYASGVAHYDLGVAFYRAGDLPRAVAHWRRAGQLRPRDTAVAHNLAMARSRVASAPAPMPTQRGWLGFVTVGELGLLATLLLAGASGLAWSRRLADVSALAALPVAVVGLALGVVAVEGWSQLAGRPLAVVVDAAAAVRDAASTSGQVRFELPPGSEVQVERRLGDFLLVRSGDGGHGWIPASAAVLVGPAGSS